MGGVVLILRRTDGLSLMIDEGGGYKMFSTPCNISL